MRITNNYTQQNSPYFGTVIASSDKVITYMNKNMSPKKIVKANKIIADQNGKKPNIHLSLGIYTRPGSTTRTPYLKATVDDEVYREGIFTSTYKVLKKAAKYVNSLNA